jgi:hypothetical protein
MKSTGTRAFPNTFALDAADRARSPAARQSWPHCDSRAELGLGRARWGSGTITSGAALT